MNRVSQKLQPRNIKLICEMCIMTVGKIFCHVSILFKMEIEKKKMTLNSMPISKML